MVRDTPRRSAAIISQSRTQKLSSKTEPEPAVSSSSTSESWKFKGTSSEASEPEMVEAKVDSHSEPPELKPPLEITGPFGFFPVKQQLLAKSSTLSPKLKTIIKGKKVSVKDLPKLPKRSSSYKRISDYARLTAGIRDISFWVECTIGARYVKRAIRHSKADMAVIMRPPVDIITVRVPPPCVDEIATICFDSKLPVTKKGENSSSSDQMMMTSETSTKFIIDNDKVFDLTVGRSYYCPNQGLYVINGGVGGVAALDWAPPFLASQNQLLAAACYPSHGFLDHWVIVTGEEQKNFENCPIKIWAIDSNNFQVNQKAIINHPFGLVRSLSWCPFLAKSLAGNRSKGEEDLAVLSAIFSDGCVRIWAISELDQGNLLLDDAITIGDDDLFVTCMTWCPVKSHCSFISVGTRDGRVLLWKLEKVGAVCVGGVRLSNRPITSLSFHHEDPLILAVGLHDSPSVLIDWRSPHAPATLQSTLANVPLVKWSRMLEAWLLADSEMSVRALPSETLIDKTSLPAGTFSSAVLDVALSPWHNIIALAGADGTVHLSFINMEKKCLLAEHQCLSICAPSNEDAVQIETKVSSPRLTKEAALLYGPERSIPLVAWSRSHLSPGLLAVALGGKGVIILLAVDHLVLLEPGN